jgi:hypothetical protein
MNKLPPPTPGVPAKTLSNSRLYRLDPRSLGGKGKSLNLLDSLVTRIPSGINTQDIKKHSGEDPARASPWGP